MNTLLITLELHQNLDSPLLDIRVAIGNQQHSIDISQPIHYLEINYDSSCLQQHTVEFVISGKQIYLDQFFKNKITANIPELMCIIDRITVEGHDITPILIKKAKYYHNTNGDSDEIVYDYTNCLGFDGCIKFTITTPIFAWYLLDYEF